MSVLIKDMEKPKFCYAITDGEAEFCPFVNTDDDCVLLSKKGICEETWEMQYSKCPLVEVQEPCENDKGCSNCMYGGRPTYKSPCSECHDKSQWEMKPISRSHENGAECEDAVSREQVLKLFSTHDGKYLYEAIQMLPSVTLKPDHNGDTTEMVEYDDCVSRQAVIDTARKVEFIFEGEYDTRTPYGVIFDVQDAVSKLPSVTPKRKTGKWIHSDFSHEFLYCSECGRGRYFCSNFCPNCGADMRSEAEQEVK